MDALINIDDFSNPMLVYSETGKTSAKYLKEVVERYQKKIFLKILGTQLYNDFVTNESVTDFWKDFIAGKDYTVDGIDFVYEGIKPILTGLIFYYWNKSLLSQLDKTDRIIHKFKESQKTMPAELMVESWNDGVELIQSRDIYKATVYHYIENNYEGSLSWIYTKHRKMNLFI